MDSSVQNQDIVDTFSRIERALDLRFEADTTLYISKEQTDKVKMHLANHNYKVIAAMAQNLGNKVIANVVLKNCWLVDCESIKTSRSRTIFSKLFHNLPQDFMLQIAGDVVNDNVYSSIEFKEFIESIYFGKISTKACNKRYQNQAEKLPNRVQCFSRYLMEDYSVNNPDTAIVRFLNDELTKYPDIENQIDKGLLRRLCENMPDKEKAATWIIENKMDIKSDVLWFNGLLSMEQIGFTAVVNHIQKKPYTEISHFLIIKLLPKFFTKLEDKAAFVQAINQLYEDFIDLRGHLIRMLTPPFSCKKTANLLVNDFEKYASIHPSHKKLVLKIRAWSTEQQNGYRSIAEIVTQFKKKTHDLTNQKTLRFFASQLARTDNKIVKALYCDHSHQNKEIETILAYYFADQLQKKQDIPKVIDQNLSASHINAISTHISKLYIKTDAAKQFLETHNQYSIIDQLFGR